MLTEQVDIRRPTMIVNGFGEESQRTLSVEAVAKTIVIFGVPRGGTTMVAGVAQRCGIDIGSDLPTNLEDPNFVDKSTDEMIATIRQRNASNTTWGWKFPRAASYLPDIQEELVNPHYVCVWRDILATSARKIRRGASHVDALLHAHKIQGQNLNVISRLNGPVLMVSYEKSVLDPMKLAVDIAAFAGTPAPSDSAELIEFARPGSYK